MQCDKLKRDAYRRVQGRTMLCCIYLWPNGNCVGFIEVSILVATCISNTTLSDWSTRS